VHRFELVEPSLNEIFIESVTGKSSARTQSAESGV
jgi:ABC-type uncharacterized transport system ATPase subunit